MIDRAALARLLEIEERHFAAAHPVARRLFDEAKRHVWGGVPLHWMGLWAGPFPIYVAEAKGSRVTDVDGHVYVDYCLGDTGALFGHAPDALTRAVTEQAGRGLTFMLPTADAAAVGERLAQRFGLPLWQFALTASDANRFAIKLARAATGRHRIVVFDGCYHGGLDETLVGLRNGVTVASPSNMGPAGDPAEISRAVPFNDLAALEDALAAGDIACVLAEPALTNFGMVLPEPGFHESLRAITRRHGTLLVIDETHTICAGPGGGTGAYGLEPDIVTLGKPLAGGMPAAAYGFTRDVAAKAEAWIANAGGFVAGIGGTLAGNALSLRAMRVALDEILTPAAYQRMIDAAARLADGLERIIASHRLGWSVARLGARVEIRFGPDAPRNAAEARAHHDAMLDRALRLWFLNRGILLTIFYNVALVSPETSDDDIGHFVATFETFAAAMGG